MKEYLKSMDRSHSFALREMFIYSGEMQVQDNQLWELFEQKIVKEKLYRYIHVKYLVRMAKAASIANRGSSEFFALLDKEFKLHQLALDEQDTKTIQQALQ